MFYATVELEDVQAAEATLGYLVPAARLATETWTVCHGIVSLVVILLGLSGHVARPTSPGGGTHQVGQHDRDCRGEQEHAVGPGEP